MAGPYKEKTGDIVLQVLLNSTMLSGGVSGLFLVVKISMTLFKKCKPKPKKPPPSNKDSIDRSFDFVRGTEEQFEEEKKKKEIPYEEYKH